jgi:ribosomal protein S18 acetylase RimI-like enzyme
MSTKVEFRESCDGIEPSALKGFFVGWPNPPSPETHLRVLKGSSHVVLAVDSTSGRVVGFINALCDGVLMAYIPLLEVLPDFQGNGIGSELTRRLLRQLDGLYAVDLLCDTPVKPFYERLGFRSEHGMSLRDFDNQCGRPE